ncbi:E3 ubiquitin-protein ligase makorin-1-like [Echinops telfairi]|uniref:E3 ubiquitin-protein ligase makorin-1-like n=1 Tax=Echinops telfairi TaxID=9371 RepID=A0AC55D860_ECHTE|nr:E3 ubiquitin-protein ligase makorin-1-like [Echinops telfairi]
MTFQEKLGRGTTSTTSGAGAAAVSATSPTPTPTPTVTSLGARARGGGNNSSSIGVKTQQATCRCFPHGVCKEDKNLNNLSDSPYRVVCKYFQQGDCIFGDCCRYEHSQPLKQEEAATIDPAAKPSLAVSSSLPPGVKPLAKMGEGELRSPNLAAVGAGAEDWANAVEFVPGQPYYGRTVLACPKVLPQGSVTTEQSEKEQPMDTKKQLCPYASVGKCSYGENCVYLHGDLCNMCTLQVLHPMDAAQRAQHIKSCIEAHKKDMELSLVVQSSKDMVCGICMEVVYEKASPSERRFGILSNCNHTYCLKCIRKWRSAKQFESKIVKSCPECRITSNFVIPSEYWVEEKEEKQKLIQKYKEAMSDKACRYFDEGRGSCPFGGNCFYKHAYSDGHREEPQRQKVGASRCQPQSRSHQEFIEEQERADPLDQDEQEDEMLLMLLATGGDEELTDSEDE